MHRQSDGQRNQLSNENNDSDFKLDENFNGKRLLPNRLPNFLAELSKQTMNLIEAYLEKNKQKLVFRKKLERKITLYEDLSWIRQCKLNQKDFANNKRSHTMQQICIKLGTFRSAVTIKERIQKMLSKLTNQQIIDHIQRNQDFCFDSKRNLVDFQKKGQNHRRLVPKTVKRETNHSQIYESNDLPQKLQNPHPATFVLRKEDQDSVPQKMSFLAQKQPQGKQSVESKIDYLSIATESIHMETPEKMNARIISNEAKKQDLAQLLIIVYNVELGTIKCIKQKKSSKPEKKPIQVNSMVLSQIKESINENETQKIQNSQITNSQLESHLSKKLSQNQQNMKEKLAQLMKENQNRKQIINRLAESEKKSNETDLLPVDSTSQSKNLTQKSNTDSDTRKAKSNTTEKLQQNTNNQEQLNKLRYKISNNELYLKLLNEDPKLSQQYIFQQQQDQALIKFIQNAQEQTLTIKCMLRYKGLDLIQERIRFLNIPVTEKFYQAIHQINGQKVEPLIC